MNEETLEQQLYDEESQTFRNQLATVTDEGKRKWIYPKKPSGRFHSARIFVSAILLLILIIIPFIKVNGYPFMLFDFLNRKFILFGILFGPHDFHLFVIAMIATVVFVILFTAIFGRIFCGWACPQTIFMEMVFRKIEYWLEGDAKDQRKLKAAPWTGSKILKKIMKHIIFFAIAFFISNIFLSYIIGMDELINIITDPPSEHLEGLFAITAFSGVFYFVFSYFREQVCTIVCPYGRLQGVLLDRDSVVIAYDNVRGEPRKRFRKDEGWENRGDCIECYQCVEVCPTGIDIRNGIQLECVNCTACIDACDDIMDKIKKPRGLIRYASVNSIEKNTKWKFTPRAIGYSSLLTVLLTVLVFLLANRTDFSVTVLRTPGLLFQEQPNNMVSNIYDLNIVNKTFDEIPISLKLENIEGELKLVGKDIVMEPQGNIDTKFLLLLPKENLKKMNTPVEIGIYDGTNLIKRVKTSFLAPLKKNEESS
ncbi:MAG: cytochrome c oxidase accessory protein CcoG [Ignavibacteria bacterium]|nr:cytochrome c oxidase accessory protein CcoG [Ignavibacteria bacterium]MBT8383576.1 cytochrome c oxidase accessory protein CcoG [Ignavibacteria bacterium]MBT8390682.1 cytochrome c oxidase accessory protein CcoG [Ignavibacteria bacterium]NNJ51718.1 cytochrome c oxidase accessory protein CcoG [Ignavibacteriaceae bacterium]NNL20709.1 cytochrome c oxidase accessory protein CcoG [Ignavibacteriaceae bacterium]